MNDITSLITVLSSKQPSAPSPSLNNKSHGLSTLIPHQLHIPLDMLFSKSKDKDKDEKDMEKKRASKRGISSTFEWSVENNHEEHFLDGILSQLPSGE